MAKEYLFRVCYGRLLEAASPEDAECLAGLSPGALVKVSVKRPRNAARLRFYWGMVNWVGEALREEGHVQWDKDLVHRAICEISGHCVEATMPDGGIVRSPKSIGFASMGEDEFIAFVKKAKDIILGQLLPALAHDDLVSNLRARGLLDELGEEFINRFC